MSKISVPQHNLNIKGDPDETLMVALLRQGIPVASSCKGDGVCGKCKMYITSEAELPDPQPLEVKTLDLAGAAPGERLSCQLRCTLPLAVRTDYW